MILFNIGPMEAAEVTLEQYEAGATILEDAQKRARRRR
jgi:hypothetical protein